MDIKFKNLEINELDISNYEEIEASNLLVSDIENRINGLKKEYLNKNKKSSFYSFIKCIFYFYLFFLYIQFIVFIIYFLVDLIIIS
ncbi:hypothetical protein IOLA_153 [uncultured bacterium]|nr:hypothetical protein IOLA_153 [uncultured bacterium]